ncbi:MAG: hypothetical protein LBU66_06435 [Treponema sp.]|jgi:hypothetical protein|nr:hypothetical protein [Treponema sp.]
MVQLFFLSILCNGLSGYLLFKHDENGTEDKAQSPLNNPTFQLVLGILSVVTGVLKLLSPFGGRAYIFGDLVPSAAGVLAGLLLIFGLYRQGKTSEPGPEKSLDAFASNLLRFRKPIGLGLIAVAVLHFLFPQALFL